MECASCNALLIDAFASEDDGGTDPIPILGGDGTHSAETDELLRAAREVVEDDFGPRESLERLSTPTVYTGDLPRLFRFGNRYQILEKLGEGGMGRVYKALDLELDRAVALKTIRTEKGTSKEVLERFKQELILARKVTHKNVIRIYDLGEYEGMKFFTMELVEGASLREVLQDETRLSVAETLSFMRQMLNGLAEAHSQGVVHRDLKPQNIMVDGNGVVRIMDFGIARTADSATMTGTGEMMGTPDYISPEQVKGETADAQSDLYSCGVILYELLTGETPFKGDTPISRIVARLQVEPRSPRELNPEIPAYLERIILKCLERDTDLRYKSADDVLDDLTREQVDSSLWLRTKKAMSRHPVWVATATLVGAIALGLYFDPFVPPPPLAAAATTSIAVLPLHNASGADALEWLESGIPEMLVTDISQLRSLRPVTTDRIQQILTDLGKDGQSRLDEETIAVVANLAGAEHALYGSYAVFEDELRLDLRLRDSATDVPIQFGVKGGVTEVFSLVDAVTDRITAELELNETNRPFVDVSTASLAAFRAYHQGLRELARGANQAAIPLLEEAVEADDGFAMAHAKLAESHFHVGNEAAAKAAIRKARERVAEAPPPRAEVYQIHAIAARVEDKPDVAVQSYRELKKLYPNEPQILFNLASSLETSGQVEEAIDTYESVLDIDPSFGGALLGLGRMLVTNRRARDAVPILQRAVDDGEFEEDLETLGMIHSILGVAQRDLFQFDLAITELERSLECRRAANDRRGVAATLTNLARVHLELGRLEPALDLLDESLAVARESDDSTMESYALLNLGGVHERSGDLRTALQNYSASLEIEWERREHTELIYRLNFIGNIYAQLGRYADAMVYLEHAKFHIDLTRDAKGEAYNLYYVGQIQRVKGDYKDAIASFLGSIPLFQQTGRVEQVANVHDELARIYVDQGRLEDAKASSAVSAELREKEFMAPSFVALSKIQGSRLALAEQRLNEVASALDEAESLLVGLDGKGVLPQWTLARGRLLRHRGDTDAAIRSLTRARELLQESGHVALELETTLELAQARLDAHQADAADELIEPLIRTAERSRLAPLLSEAHIARARVWISRGRPDRARDDLNRASGLATEFDGRRLLRESDRLRALFETEHTDH